MNRSIMSDEETIVIVNKFGMEETAILHCWKQKNKWNDFLCQAVVPLNKPIISINFLLTYHVTDLQRRIRMLLFSQSMNTTR